MADRAVFAHRVKRLSGAWCGGRGIPAPGFSCGRSPSRARRGGQECVAGRSADRAFGGAATGRERFPAGLVSVRWAVIGCRRFSGPNGLRIVGCTGGFAAGGAQPDETSDLARVFVGRRGGRRRADAGVRGQRNGPAREPRTRCGPSGRGCRDVAGMFGPWPKPVDITAARAQKKGQTGWVDLPALQSIR